MRDWEEKEVTDFAAALLRGYYCDGEVEQLISAFSEDILWLGGGLNQSAEGRKNVEKRFRNSRTHLAKSHMRNESFAYRKLAADIYLCQVRSDLCEKNEEGASLLRQRCTFLFRREGEELKIVYIHSSSPYETWRAERQRDARLAEAEQLTEAVLDSYEMIMSVNLTRNTYHMISYNAFVDHSAPEHGCFDALIEQAAGRITPPFREPFRERMSRERLLEAHGKGRPSVHLEYQQLGDDGQKHWIYSHVMFTQNHANDDVVELTVSRCIDDIREKEEQKKEMLRTALNAAEQANHTKSRFLSEMSHDIRTPMNAVLGMTAIALENLDDREKVRECLQKIQTSSGYLIGLIDEILELSRIESGKLNIIKEEFEIRKMLDAVYEIMNVRMAQKSQEFVMRVAEDVEQCYEGDEFRLQQCLMNLLSNANKYTASEGKISLDISVETKNEKHHVLRMDVCDNGVGIRQDFMDKLFEAFEQGEEHMAQKGSGLGLAIVKNLLMLMGGTISVQSTRGEGSCFSIRLPLTPVKGRQDGERQTASDCDREKENEAVSESGGQAAAKRRLLPAGTRVLLAEDNELNREVAVTILTTRGLEVEVAVNGREAVEKFLASSPGTYTAILMDIQMPELNGYEATEQIRHSRHADAVNIPIYAMTANAFSEDITRALTSGMNAHLAKPLNFEKLISLLEDAVRAGKRKKRITEKADNRFDKENENGRGIKEKM